MILLHDFLKHRFRAFDVVFRLCRVYCGIGLQLARLVENCNLAAGPVSRVNGDNAFPLYRRRHQKTFCILGKNLHGLGFCSLGEQISHFSFYRRSHKSLICICDGLLKKSEENILFVLDYAACDYAVHLLRIHCNLNLQLLFLFSSVHGQNSVVRDFGKCLLVVVVHLVNRLFLRVGGFRCNNRFCKGLFSDILCDFCVVGNHLGDYIAGSLKSICCCIYFLLRVDKRLRRFLRRAVSLKLCENNHGQRLQSLFLCLGCTGGLLLLVRLVKVLYSLQHLGFFDFRTKFFRQFPLLFDEADYLILSLFQISQVFKPFIKVTQYHIGKSPGYLFTVSGDKRDGIALVYELHGVLHLCSPDFKFACKFLNYVHIFNLFPSLF